MHRLEQTTAHQLLKNVNRDDSEYVAMIPQLWQMMDTNYIFFDVNEPLTMNTEISV